MDNKIVIDLEIQDPIIHESDWDNTDKIKISCCCTYSYLEDRYHVYGPTDIEHLRATIACADLVIGYNINKFDIPVIFGLPAREQLTGIHTYDILAEIWKTLGLDPTTFSDAHKGYSLGAVAKATLNKGKTGSGANAPFLWKQGNFWRVIDYCLNDVALTKDLYDTIQKCGFVFTKHKMLVEHIILNKEVYDRFQKSL